MNPESSNQSENISLIPKLTELARLPNTGSPAMAEIISRSLVHIQTSTLATTQRRAGEEKKFEIAAGVSIVMCWIPPGEFLMSSPKREHGRHDYETQQRESITQGFWLAKTQTTQAQWEAVMGSNPSYFVGSDLPVETVNWNDISGPGGFMEKVNRFTTAGGIFSFFIETQWEYACRSGTTTDLNSGKNVTTMDGVCPNVDEIAWYSENSGEEPYPVGIKIASAWGLHDMHGNVWEWCENRVDKDESNLQSQATNATSGELIIARGGSYCAKSGDCRASARLIHHGPFCDIGFRLACSSLT